MPRKKISLKYLFPEYKAFNDLKIIVNGVNVSLVNKFSGCPTLMVPMHAGCTDCSCDNQPLNIFQLISTAAWRYTFWRAPALSLTFHHILPPDRNKS
jgi:hypothetical protein